MEEYVICKELQNIKILEKERMVDKIFRVFANKMPAMINCCEAF